MDFYYEVRDRRFNPWRATLLAQVDLDSGTAPDYPTEVAAMLVYLNRTGFNGLFRLNSQGLFNVPAGRYVNPRVCDADNLRAVARALGEPGVEIRFQSFETVLREADRGDFLYFDPPYAPLSETACFTSYTADGFTDWHQRRLQRTVVALASRGCQVLLSNSTAPLVQELYVGSAAARDAGLVAHTVLARRAINSRASRRGPVHEFVITNLGRTARSGGQQAVV
jgi:DNA adenine methylase